MTPPVAVPVREALPVVVVPVRVESRVESRSKSKPSKSGKPNRNSDFTNKMELRGKIDLLGLKKEILVIFFWSKMVALLGLF